MSKVNFIIAIGLGLANDLQFLSFGIDFKFNISLKRRKVLAIPVNSKIIEFHNLMFNLFSNAINVVIIDKLS